MFEGPFLNYFAKLVLELPAIVLTAIAILVLYHAFSPRMFFSQFVRVQKFKKNDHFSYSIKTLKMGSIDLIDTSVRCRLAIQDISKTGATIWNFYDVPTTFSDSLRVGKGFRIVHLMLDQAAIAAAGENIYFDKHIEYARPDCGLRFEDVFMTYKNSYIVVYVLGHDRFTGVKKLYASPKYYFAHLRRGHWLNVAQSVYRKTDLDLVLGK